MSETIARDASGERTIVVTGVHGQVGFELLRSLQGLGRVVGMSRDALDLSRPDAIRSCIRSLRPAVIVNAAAYTAVDRAEQDVDSARMINAEAPAVLAEEARRSGALLIHYSTDYVFDGALARPYIEDDATVPLNIYGVTKRDGELAIVAAGCAHLIFRTSWVYGRRGGNFLTTMLRLSNERDELRIVADQVGAPTWSATIATLTAHVLSQGVASQVGLSAWGAELSGIYHMSAAGSTSWAGFAEHIFAVAAPARVPAIVPIPAIEYPTLAKRPANSRLDTSKLQRAFSLTPPQWDDALALCVASM
ncbi:dTDP-4-dehydrorhamnose reductase [Burkholderia singularis]|uniref:dTDP-4-dehydrorhamnose reductase n=1 Tax=Burkholderia singularis TaxID=1503053 RepID=A0A238H7S6_9BURK|nr:dTDP-4-dehydrorhamnose reductase [Burkholderia singularis]SMG01318.1 dTDP-4-dehydrorhamnose reductase [Burkholderia singularis]